MLACMHILRIVKATKNHGMLQEEGAFYNTPSMQALNRKKVDFAHNLWQIMALVKKCENLEDFSMFL